MWRNAEQGSESKRCSHVYAQTINTIYSEYPECRRGVHCLLWTVLGHTTYAPDKLGQRRTKYCSAGMAAHLIADTACLPSLTSCSCVHNHVRPAAQTQRLAQRKSGAFSSQHSCHLPRRRTGRNTSRIFARAAQGQGQRTQVQLPEGYVRYETMIVLRPDMNDENRDIELAKFEAFLNREQCKEIKALVRGRQQLAYPIKGFWEGIYVLYTYAAKRTTSQKVQKHLSTPIVGGEANILRHMTFCT